MYKRQGVTLSAFLIYALPSPNFDGAIGQGTPQDFLSHPNSIPFLAAVASSSIFMGIYVVPLQAMTQRRAHPRIRAQLMSAGSVLYNFAVNILTFGLIGLALLNMPPKAPFLMVVIGSALVSIYAVWRCYNMETRKAYILSLIHI